MKKRFMIVLLVSLGVLASGCGKAGKIDSKGLLPSSITKLQEGGAVSDAYNPQIEEPKYPEDLLFATWCMEDAVNVDLDDEFEFPTKSKIELSYIDLDKGKKASDQVCVFPVEFTLLPNTEENIGSPHVLSTFSFNYSSSIESIVENTSDNVLMDDGVSNGAQDYERTLEEKEYLYPFGVLAENLNAMQGSVRYINANADKTEWGDYVEHSFYSMNLLSGDTLAFGLTNVQYDDLLLKEGKLTSTNTNTCEIQEIDYKISFEDSKLKLTYGDESVTYVSTAMLSESNPCYKDAGLVKGTNPIDDIQCLTISEYETRLILNNVVEDSISANEEDEDLYHRMRSGIVKNLIDGYIDADFSFNTKKNSVTVKSSDGAELQYDCILSDYAIALQNGDSMAVYSTLNPIEPSPNYDPNYGMSYYTISNINGGGAASFINVGNDELTLYTDMQLEEFTAMGFETNVDMNQYMDPGEVTDQIMLSIQSNDNTQQFQMKVKVVNPFENKIPLGKCVICSIYVNDSTGVIRKGDGSMVGVTTKDRLEYYYKPAYSNEDNQLIYKIQLNYRAFADVGAGAYYSDNLSANLSTSATRSDDCGNIMLDWRTDNTAELTYFFDDGGLMEAFEISIPALLYNGLQDNVERAELKKMSAAKITATTTVRETILERLKGGFATNNISVDIDELSGKITMNNSVLFDYDSYALTSEGKSYIDAFMKVYTSVILDDEFADVITGVEFDGHTDSRGSYSYNQSLSENRANSVLNYMSAESNSLSQAQKEQLKLLSIVKGYAFSDLIYDENGNEDRNASRRVEIKFYIKVE